MKSKVAYVGQLYLANEGEGDRWKAKPDEVYVCVGAKQNSELEIPEGFVAFYFATNNPSQPDRGFVGKTVSPPLPTALAYEVSTDYFKEERSPPRAKWVFHPLTQQNAEELLDDYVLDVAGILAEVNSDAELAMFFAALILI